MKQFLSIFIIVSLSFSCGNTKTPKAYKYTSVVSPSQYSSDSIVVLSTLNFVIKSKIDSFGWTKTFNSTSSTIYLDSILYGPNQNQMVILVILKLDNTKIEFARVDTIRYSYFGYFFYCTRDSSQSSIKLFMNRSFSFSQFESYPEIKDVMKDYSFRRRSTEHPWTENEPMYNFDDNRFWKGDQFKYIVSKTPFGQMPVRN